MEDAKKKFIEIRDAIVIGDKPLQWVMPNYTPEKLTLALAAYRKTPSWRAYEDYMRECVETNRRAEGTTHTRDLGIVGGLKEAKDFFESNFNDKPV